MDGDCDSFPACRAGRRSERRNPSSLLACRGGGNMRIKPTRPGRSGLMRVAAVNRIIACTLAGVVCSCALSPPVSTSVAALLSDPRRYVHRRVEVSGTVAWGGAGHRDFAYWHFHLKAGDEEIVCYSAAYKYQVWATIDHVIRRAAASGKTVTVVGYLVPWEPGRAVLRARWITYEGRTYDAEFLPPAASMGVSMPALSASLLRWSA